MTDGVPLNVASGGPTVATDELSTINGVALGTPQHAQRMKIIFGTEGSGTDANDANPFPVTVKNLPATQPVSAVSLPLPTGAATAAAQATTNDALTAIYGALAGTLGIAGTVSVSNFPGTQAVTAASLPLPSGAATSALQGTGNATLASILTALGSPLQAGGSVGITGTVPISAAALPLPSGAATASNQTATNTALSAISGQLPATLGQKAMGQSLSVTMASDQSALPISAASLPLPTGAATAANQATGNTSLANLDTDVGAISATPAAADGTGDYSLIAAAKRALLNWANLLARLPAALGQALMAGSFPVAIASDQSAVNVSPDKVLDNLTTTGSVTSATTVVSVSTAGFMGGSFHVTSAGSATVTYEQSNDNTNWETLTVIRANTNGQQPVTTSTVAGIFRYESPAAFVRARVSAYTSGTVAITLTQKRVVSPSGGVSLQAGSSSIGAVSLNASSNTIGGTISSSGFTDSTTSLGISATFTGTSRTTTNPFSAFAARAYADQAGTLFIDQSINGAASWEPIASTAVAAGTAASLRVDQTGAAGQQYRVRYVNGGAAQGVFRLSSAFLA